MLFKGIIVVLCENYAKHVIILRGGNGLCLGIEVCGTYNNLLLLFLPRRYSPVGPRAPLMRFLNLTLIDNW
jgi:hypothetical protein